MSQDGTVRIEIDGQSLLVKRELTILEAARQNGIEIPTLCDFPGLPPHGSCRMCVVEITGRQNTPTACTTPVEAGMVVSTHSPAVMALRKELLQMLLAEHPSGCLFCPEKDHCDECMITVRKAGVTTGCGSCPKNGQCELQALAEKYDVKQPGYPIRYRMLPVESHDPFFDRDPNLCILCGRCIRVCQDLHFTNTLTFNGRGAQALVSTAFERAHLETACTFCGTCVEICPTGALSEKTRKWNGKPERETASTCPFCSTGCQITLLSHHERVTGSLPNHQAGTDVLCASGRFGVTELVNPTLRLKHPQQTAGETWQPASWEEAIQTAAEKLSACPPKQFEMRVSAACSNEDLFVARQFTRTIMKSNPVLASTRQRYGSAFESLSRLLRATVLLEALAEAQTILCIGFEERYTQSVVAVQLKRAKKRGAKIIHLSHSLTGATELDMSDVRLSSANGDGYGLAAILAALNQRLAVGGSSTIDPDVIPAMEQAARLLTQSGAPVIVVSAPALAEPQNEAMLLAIETLAHRLEAQVVLLPEESNLVGALRLGLTGLPADSSGLEVVYQIGEPLPEDRSEGLFFIAHTLALPDGGVFNGLLLPETAFSEVDGTFLNHSGQVKMLHPAVLPPGEALPAWQVLARIARQMGAPGFEYECVEDIWQAAQAEFAGFPASHAWPELTVPAAGDSIPGAGWREPIYMGQPLSRRVAGLRSLYCGSSTARTNEPDS